MRSIERLMLQILASWTRVWLTLGARQCAFGRGSSKRFAPARVVSKINNSCAVTERLMHSARKDTQSHRRRTSYATHGTRPRNSTAADSTEPEACMRKRGEGQGKNGRTDEEQDTPLMGTRSRNRTAADSTEPEPCMRKR